MNACTTCGGMHFEPAEYLRRGARPAPALACAHCGTLLLDESIARSDIDLAAVRAAQRGREEVALESQRMRAVAPVASF